jgi:hypothetical protein
MTPGKTAAVIVLACVAFVGAVVALEAAVASRGHYPQAAV